MKLNATDSLVIELAYAVGGEVITCGPIFRRLKAGRIKDFIAACPPHERAWVKSLVKTGAAWTRKHRGAR